MAQDGCWGDGIVLSAASLLYKRSIVIHYGDKDKEPVRLSDNFSDANVMHFGYLNNNHYVALLSKPVSVANSHCDPCVADIRIGLSTNAVYLSDRPRNGAEQSSVVSTSSLDVDETVEVETMPTSSRNLSKDYLDPVDISQLKEHRPAQPVKTSYPKSIIGKQNRAFCASVYTRFAFVEYSVERDAVFCFTCRHFNSRSCNSDTVFTRSGFRNWKRLNEALTKHSQCDSHLLATALYSAWCESQKTGSVVSQIEDHANGVAEQNRDVVRTLSRIAIVCGRQGLALRGHREACDDSSSNMGNFLSILQVIELENSDFKEKLKAMPKNARYISKDSQNEILQAATAVILDKICNEIKGASCFSVIADEARDASRSEQMSICI